MEDNYDFGHDYGYLLQFQRPYYRTHELNGRIALAPMGVPHRGPIPGLTEAGLRPSRLFGRRNPRLWVDTQRANRAYNEGWLDTYENY